LLSH